MCYLDQVISYVFLAREDQVISCVFLARKDESFWFTAIDLSNSKAIAVHEGDVQETNINMFGSTKYMACIFGILYFLYISPNNSFTRIIHFYPGFFCMLKSCCYKHNISGLNSFTNRYNRGWVSSLIDTAGLPKKH